MVERTRRAALREGLETALQFAVVLAVVGGWSWATWDVEGRAPDTPVFDALGLLSLVGGVGLFLVWIVLAARDGRRAEAAERNAPALQRATDQSRSPRTSSRPLLSAAAVPVAFAGLCYSVLPDFLALASGADPVRIIVASSCVLAAVIFFCWAMVAGIRKEIISRRSETR